MKTPHVHAAMIKEWAEDTSRVVEYFDGEDWWGDLNPKWHPDCKYRFRHKHQDLIDAKAARPELIIERKIFNGWTELDGEPMWHEQREYRLVEPRHKHQDLIDRKKERPELIVEWRRANYGDWTICPTDLLFLLNEDIKYRLVEPPKQKKMVKMWQWLVQGSSTPILANSFYSSKEEAEHGLGRDVIQRADWTEISIEVAK